MSEATERYAAALFGTVNGDAQAVREAADTLMADSKLWNTLQSPAVTAAEKKELIAGAACPLDSEAAGWAACSGG